MDMAILAFVRTCGRNKTPASGVGEKLSVRRCAYKLVVSGRQGFIIQDMNRQPGDETRRPDPTAAFGDVTAGRPAGQGSSSDARTGVEDSATASDRHTVNLL